MAPKTESSSFCVAFNLLSLYTGQNETKRKKNRKKMTEKKGQILYPQSVHKHSRLLDWTEGTLVRTTNF